MSSFTIREITEGELNEWWQLRLQAIRDHPDAFGADYEISLRNGPNYVERGYFQDGPNALFAAFTASGDMWGVAGVFRESGKQAHIGKIVSVYTHPDYRRRGVGEALVQASIQHLRRFPDITSIRISVNATNIHAAHTYEKLGFVPWGEEPDAIRLADGTTYNEVHMVLR